MTVEQELSELLGMIAENINLEHCSRVDDKYRKALSWEEVDRPPLVVQPEFGTVINLPAPWDKFQRYSYSEAFDNPAKMLVNQLLNRVVPGILLNDDNPLAIRNEHGTIQVASVLGGNWKMHVDNYPWVESFGSIELLEVIANSSGPVDDAAGVLQKSLDTLRYYTGELSKYPPCYEAIQISLPDLQGPIDTAEQLWGSDIYYSLTDTPELLAKLLSRIVDVQLDVAEKFRKFSTDRLDPFANTQHGYMIPGRILIRNDSSIMLSPKSYAEYVRPHDARLLKEIGTGSIHFCGNGQQLVLEMLEIEDLRGLDFGEAHLMDKEWIYEQCKACKVAVTNYKPSREDLMSGKARRDFPTGVVLTYMASGIEDAMEVVEAYKKS